MNDASRTEHLAAAIDALEAAGPIALRWFRNPLTVDDKSGGQSFDPVTRADREVESAVRARLAAAYPDYGILGEEEGLSLGSNARRWILDPIDGTRAYVSGMPGWGMLLGLVEDDACLLGAMHQPFLRETFAGTPEGAVLRTPEGATPLRTRGTTRLEDALLYCTHPSMFPESWERQAFERLSNDCRMQRFGGDCYAYCLLALGQIDLVVEGRLEPYDIIPLIPIIEGAGGVVTSWTGGPAIEGGRVVAAANASLHALALARLGAA